MNLAETGDEKFIELISSGTIDQINDYVDNVLMEMYNVDNIKDVGYKVYESLQGEVEARVASNRMNMSSDERREKMPSFGNSLLLEELEDDKTFSKALSTQNKRTDNVQNINNEVKSRHKEDEKRTSGNMVAGSDEAAFSMQEKGAPLSGDKSPQVGFKATGQAPDIDNIPTNEQDVNIETEKKYSAEVDAK